MLEKLAPLALGWLRAYESMLTAQNSTLETRVSIIDGAASSYIDADCLDDAVGSSLSGVTANDLVVCVPIMERV